MDNYSLRKRKKKDQNINSGPLEVSECIIKHTQLTLSSGDNCWYTASLPE